MHQPQRVFPAPLHWVELPICWAVVPCQKRVLSATSFIDALKWRLCPFPWANESDEGWDQVLYWTDLYFSKCEHQRETHPRLLSAFAFIITCMLESVYRNIIVCIGGTETESTSEFRGKQIQKIALYVLLRLPLVSAGDGDSYHS